MRCTTPMATVLTAFFLVGTSGPQANSAEPTSKKTQSDQDRLQGVWIAVIFTEMQKDRMLISGDRMYWYVGKKTITGTFSLDATKRPKQINLNIREKDRTIVLQGIYQFQKSGVLSICTGKAHGPRPTYFKATKKQSIIHFVRGKQGIKTGAYTATVKGDDWTLNLDKKGRVTVKKKGRAVVEGTFIATKTELIVFPDQKEPLTSNKTTKTGRYKWKLDGKKLSFTKIDDDCTDRAKAITASAWVRKD